MEYLIKNWLGIALIGLGVFAISIGLATAKRVNDSANWPSTPGEITKSMIVTKQRRRRRSRPTTQHLPEIQFEYTVGSSKLMHKQLYFSNQSPAQVVKKYPKGSNVVVKYNPNDINDSFLEPPELANSYVMYGMGAFLVLLGVSFLAAAVLFRNSNHKGAISENTAKLQTGDQKTKVNPTDRKHRTRPETIGDISAVIGHDVRELKLDGWSDQQIQELMDEKLAGRN